MIQFQVQFLILAYNRGDKGGINNLRIHSFLKDTQIYFRNYSSKIVVVSKGLVEVSESLKTENEEFKKRYNDATSKALQLEEDIVSVTHKAIEKETELDRYF